MLAPTACWDHPLPAFLPPAHPAPQIPKSPYLSPLARCSPPRLLTPNHPPCPRARSHLHPSLHNCLPWRAPHLPPLPKRHSHQGLRGGKPPPAVSSPSSLPDVVPTCFPARLLTHATFASMPPGWLLPASGGMLDPPARAAHLCRPPCASACPPAGPMAAGPTPGRPWEGAPSREPSRISGAPWLTMASPGTITDSSTACPRGWPAPTASCR